MPTRGVNATMYYFIGIPKLLSLFDTSHDQFNRLEAGLHNIAIFLINLVFFRLENYMQFWPLKFACVVQVSFWQSSLYHKEARSSLYV